MEGRKRKSYTRFTGTSATRRGESAPWTGEGKVSVGVFAGRVANEGAALGEETWQPIKNIKSIKINKINTTKGNFAQALMDLCT